MTVEDTLKSIEAQMARLTQQRDNVLLIGEKLKGFPHQVSLSVFGEYVDFENLTREQVIALIAHINAGKWDKSASHQVGKIDYVNKSFFKDAKLRIWAADPPESCKLVEVEIEIPAQPARIEKRIKLVCKENELAAV